MIKHGYTLQFRRRPPRFKGVVQSLTLPRNAQVLKQEVRNLFKKGAIEKVPLSEREIGFYRRYFVIPKRDRGLCPILDLRPINRALGKRPFRILTQKQILAQIHPGGLVCVRGFKGRVLSHSDSTTSQMLSEVCFRGHSVPILCSPVRGWLWPYTLFEVHRYSTFPPQNERDAHSKLFGRLAEFSSVPGHTNQPHRLAAYSLGIPRAMCQHAEEHSRPWSVHNISGSVLRLRGDESPPLAGTRGGHFVFPAPFRARQLCSFKGISEAAVTHGVCFSCMSSGIITHG